MIKCLKCSKKYNKKKYKECPFCNDKIDEDYVEQKKKKGLFKFLMIVSILVIILVILFLIITEVFGLCCPNPNLGGYCVKGTTLTGYMGFKKEIIIPDNIETISGGAFNADFGKGVFLEKVTVPGTVRKIDDGAFGTSNIDTLIIEEGVEVIGSYAFHNVLLKEIWFPKSIKVVEKRILDCEEGPCSSSIKIHLYKDSEMDYYFKKNEPLYDEVEYIYED